MRKKSLKRRLSNILLLGILLAIIVGIYYNIRNSRAENILEITGIAVDNYGYLENEEVILEAKDIGNDQYEIELPDNINSKMINGTAGVTLVDKEKVEDETLEEVPTTEGTEEVSSTDAEEETLTDEEQNVENTSENTVIEIKDGKITLSKEQLENKQINLEVTYEMAIKEKLEDGTYQKELLSEKTEEERNAIEITEETEVLYSKILKYEDEENGKVVELKGYLPKDAKLKVEEVAIEELTEIFGDAKLDVAYDIKIIMQVTKLVPVDESNPEGEMQEEIETIEINPEDFSEKCEVSIKDKNILANSQVYHVKEDNTYEQVEVIENTEENISFEATTFSTYVVSQDEGLMAVSEEENTVASTETDDANAGLDTSEQVVVNFTPTGARGKFEGASITVTAEVFGKNANIVAYRWEKYTNVGGDWTYLQTPAKTITVTQEFGEIAGMMNYYLCVLTEYEDENGLYESEYKSGLFSYMKNSTFNDTEPPVGIFNKTTNSEYEQDPEVILSFSDETAIDELVVRLQWSEINEVGTDTTYKPISQPTEENGWQVSIAPPQNIEGTFYLRGKYFAWDQTNHDENGVTLPGNDSIKYIKAGPFLIDTKAPTLNIIHSVNSTKSAVTINASASETATGSGIAEYKFDDDEWTTSSSKVYTKNGTYTVQVKDNAGNVTSKTTTINEIETEAPTITIREPEQKWMKTCKILVGINDTYSGLAEGATLKYGWSTSNTQEPTRWTQVTVGGYEAGETEASFSRLATGLTGKYYLWVKPVNLKDIVGNEATETKVSANAYWFDYTAPSYPSVNGTTANWTNQDIVADITSSDSVSGNEESGIVRFEYSYDNSIWYGDTADWDGNTITTENGVSSITKTWTDEIDTTLYVRAIDLVENTSEVASKQIRIDKTNPTITVNPTLAEATSSVDITITAAELGGSGFSTSNEYKYQMGRSNSEAPTGTWSAYQSGASMNIGTNLSGEYYLWVKAISDVAGNTSTSNGTTVDTYHVFGPYIFDNILQSVIITGEATGVTDGLIRHYDGTNNTEKGHSNPLPGWSDLSGNFDAVVRGGTFNDNHLSLDSENAYVELNLQESLSAITLEASFMLKSGITTQPIFHAEGGLMLAYTDGRIVITNGNENIVFNDELLHIDTEKIYNISMTYDGQLLKLYIDEVKHGEVAAPISLDLSGLVLGSTTNPSSFNIYSARVYNRALSQDEIKKNLNADRINVETANNDSVTLSFIFANDVIGFDLDDITITNGSKGTLTKISNSEYTLEVTDIVAEENLTVSVAEGSYTDVDGNLGSATRITRYRDTKGPVATITADTTNSTTTTYNIKFNESTVGFEKTDIRIQGGALNSFTRVSSSEYNVVVNNTENEDQIFEIISDAAFDSAGNGNINKRISIDLTAPTITINPQENTTWQKSHSVGVTVADENSGLAEGATLQYAWSKDNTTEPTEWTTMNLTEYTAGATTTTTTVASAGLTGKYYLWVKPLTIKDTAGNVATEVLVSGEFRFDNVAPTISIDETLNATSITAEDYGGYVTNYASSTSTAQSSVSWRIFHTDGSNIYLIADNYIENQYKPAGKSGTNYSSSSGTYGANLMASNDYTGMSDISSTLKSKLLSQYGTYTSTNNNAKATAYLLDTNVWSGFANSSYADYAIGGPSLELFVDSYNTTHSTGNTLETQVIDKGMGYGYEVKWNNGEWSGTGSNTVGIIPTEGLYITGDGSLSGMWIASPFAYHNVAMMALYGNGQLGGVPGNSVSMFGIRPVVLLKSDVQLEKQSDGTYKIVEVAEAEEKTWAQTHNVEVTISDNHSGLAEGATLQYGWSESNTKLPTEWSDAIISEYTAGETVATFTATGTGLTGKYYLCVKPVTLKDISLEGGNSQIGIQYSTDTYWFDNTNPALTIEAENSETWAKSHSATIKITDEHSGFSGEAFIMKYGWYSPSKGTLENIEELTITPTKGAKEAQATISGTGLTGEYYLQINVTVGMKDATGNGNTGIMQSESIFKFDNTNPALTIEAEQSETWAKEHSATIKITDEHSGLSGGNFIMQYSWYSLSKGKVENTKQLIITTTAGAKEASATISEVGLTGKYYLQISFIPAIDLENQDLVGNGLGGIYQSEETFWFDNTAPAMPEIKNSSHGEWTNQNVQIDVTSADNVSGDEESGITRFEYSYDNSTWYGDTADWDGNTIATTGAFSSISKTWTDERNTTLYIRAIDMTGNISEVASTELRIDKNLPTVTASPEKTINSNANDYVQSQNVTIILADTGESGLSVGGKYYLSTNENSLENGTWKTYTSGTAFPIEGDGIFYLFVETIRDSAGNTSTANGTLTTIDGTKYHRFGPYKIDNTAPNILVNGSNISSGEKQITAETLTAEHYGGYVTNYASSANTAQSSVNWRIFHSDGENIYLIADTYIENQYKPSGKNGTNYNNTSGTYGANLNALNDYAGMSDISSTLKSKLLSQYGTYTSTNYNAKATAYLLDTNVWSGFANSSYADYAIGGPSLELFVDSYNTTHAEENTLETQVVDDGNGYGYEVKWSNEEWTGDSDDYWIEGMDTSESLYVISNTYEETVIAMFLASPSANYPEYILGVLHSGHVERGSHYHTNGRCPPDSFSKI